MGVIDRNDPITAVIAKAMSYGTDVADMVSVYTGVILRGARSVDLAVLQPTKFAFVLNKQRERLTPKTARSSLL
jgi:putative tryptophan/tyrosine transport system substrate-binding protein